MRKSKYLSQIQQAKIRIAGWVQHTPLSTSNALSQRLGGKVFAKLELFQRTGSFKIRSVYNRLLTLSRELTSRGLITASAGNHAQALALAASSLEIPSTIFMPETTPIVKVEATRGYGARVELYGSTFDDAKSKAKEFMETHGLAYIDGFDDWEIIYGAGTVGLEIVKDLPATDVIVCPVGGGGLISGVALAAKGLNPRIQVIGVQSINYPAMKQSVEKHCLTSAFLGPTIAEGIAIKTPGLITYEVVSHWVDEIVTVTDDEIAESILFLMERFKIVAEGAGAAALVPILKEHPRLRDKTVVAIISGGNIDLNTISTIITRGLARAGRYLHFCTHVPDTTGNLKKLVDEVSALKGNILDITHDRTFPELPLAHVKIDIILEIRNKEHGQAILKDLRSLGYSVRQVI